MKAGNAFFPGHYLTGVDRFVPFFRNDRVGVYDTICDTLCLEPIYRKAYFIENNVILIDGSNKYGAFSLPDKQVLPFIYDKIGWSNGMFVIELNGKKGLADQLGNVVITPVFDDIRGFDNGYAAVKTGDLWGAVDRSKLAIPMMYRKIGLFSEDGLVIAQNTDYSWGVISSSNEVIIPFRYRQAAGFVKGIALLDDIRINSAGDIIGKAYVNSISNLRDYECILRADRRYTTDDHPLLHSPYSEATREKLAYRYMRFKDYHDGLMAVERSNQWGFIDVTGKEVISCSYYDVGYFHEGFAKVSLGMKWGAINKQGQIVIPCQYDSLGDFSEGLASVRCGYLSTDGQLAIDLSQTCRGQPSDFHGGVAWAQSKNFCHFRRMFHLGQGERVHQVNSQLRESLTEKYTNYHRMISRSGEFLSEYGFFEPCDFLEGISVAKGITDEPINGEVPRSLCGTIRAVAVRSNGEILDIFDKDEDFCGVSDDGTINTSRNTWIRYKGEILPVRKIQTKHYTNCHYYCEEDHDRLFIIRLEDHSIQEVTLSLQSNEGIESINSINILTKVYNINTEEKRIESTPNRLFDMNGNVIADDSSYSSIEECYKYQDTARYLVHGRDGWGCIDNNGKPVIACQYDAITLESSQQFRSESDWEMSYYFMVHDKSGWGCYTLDGKEVVSCAYDKIEFIDGNYIIVCSDNKWGLFSLNGYKVLDCQFESISGWGVYGHQYDVFECCLDGYNHVCINGVLVGYSKNGGLLEHTPNLIFGNNEDGTILFVAPSGEAVEFSEDSDWQFVFNGLYYESRYRRYESRYRQETIDLWGNVSTKQLVGRLDTPSEFTRYDRLDNSSNTSRSSRRHVRTRSEVPWWVVDDAFEGDDEATWNID